ncbi:MAG: AMP-binding protein, partial [Paraglaciecola sp.]|nr:AMP-binding protein [Paraglaciecola sp.]
EDKVSMLADYAQQHNKQFFVMYGQTEATARMAYLPSEVIAAKPQSIGRAIPGGEFVLHDEQGQVINQAGQTGELIYRGANVMLGYAEQLKDLAQLIGVDELKTGDLAYRDDDGDYVISGRVKRFIKLFGLRINLDEIENILTQQGLACYCLGDDSKLLVAVKNHNQTADLKINLSRQLHLHHSAIEVFNVDALPLTTNGKKDYPAMLQVLGR